MATAAATATAAKPKEFTLMAGDIIGGMVAAMDLPIFKPGAAA